MKKLFVLAVVCGLGLVSIGCGDTKPAPAVKKGDVTKPGSKIDADKPDIDKMEGHPPATTTDLDAPKPDLDAPKPDLDAPKPDLDAPKPDAPKPDAPKPE